MSRDASSERRGSGGGGRVVAGVTFNKCVCVSLGAHTQGAQSGHILVMPEVETLQVQHVR